MFAIKGGKVITVTGPVIESGVILIRDGKICGIGDASTKIPESCQVVDVSGKWVYPGFIDASTHIGMQKEPCKHDLEIQDYLDAGDLFTPQLRAMDAINPQDNVLRKVRTSGITTCFVAPGAAGPIDGRGVSVKLRNAETVEDVVIPDSEQMCFTLGDEILLSLNSQKKPPYTRMSLADSLRDHLRRAKAAMDSEKGKEDPKLDALAPVLRGEMKARFACLRADDIAAAVRLAEEFALPYCIVGGFEAHKIPRFLQAHHPEMILDAVPFGIIRGMMMMSIYDTSFDNAAAAAQAGCLGALTMNACSSAACLPFVAGFATAYGLEPQKALEAITIGPARVLGLDARIGSLEVGKDADLAIYSGDALLNSSLCEMTWIDGEMVYRR